MEIGESVVCDMLDHLLNEKWYFQTCNLMAFCLLVLVVSLIVLRRGRLSR